MKKVQFITTIAIALAMNLSNVFASENTVKKATNQKMAEVINKVFNTMPTEDLMNKENEIITIHFKVDKDNKFKLLKVDGNNKDLVRYSTIVLTKKEIVFDNSIEPKLYELPVKFVNL
jgi:hypothetical protein